MKKRHLRNLEVSAIGYGCMGFSVAYGAVPNEETAISLIRKSYEEGCTFFDTAESYGFGDGHNEKLLGKAVKPFRKDIVLASKILIESEALGGSDSEYLDGSLESLETLIRKRLEQTLINLDTNYLDLYYQHRVNPDIPVEEVATVMGKLIDEGKIKGWGQSQATESQIRSAHAITPLTAVQSEYSIMERQFEKDVIPTCKELNIGFVPFSPLASGFLSGKVKKDDKFEGADLRRVISRFDEENIKKNQPIIDFIHEFAVKKNATPAQISLTWMIHKENFIVPIPGMRKEDRLHENLSAADIELTEEEFQELEENLNKLDVYGNRKDEDNAKLFEE